MGDDEPDDKKKTTGLLSDAAGGGAADDGIDDKDLAELRVTKADLVKIAAIAKGDINRWTPRAATSGDSYEPWRALGRKIAGGASEPGVVADELARFVGGDKSNRIEDPRPAAAAERRHLDGRARQLPGRGEDAAEAVHRARHRRVGAADRGQGEERRTGRGRQGGARSSSTSSTSSTPTSRARMPMRSSAACRRRCCRRSTSARPRCSAARRRNAGKQSDADELEALKSEYGRLRKDCVHYEVMEEAPLKEVLELIDGRKEIRALEFKDAVEPIRQLSDLYAIWKRDIEKASALGKKIGRPETDLDRYRPDLARLREAEEGLPALRAGRPAGALAQNL